MIGLLSQHFIPSLSREVADILRGGSFHDDTISEDLIRQRKIKEKAIEIARQELKVSPSNLGLP